jgi:DNA topoisomerase-1
VPNKPTGLAGLSVRNGPVKEYDMDVDISKTNGNKRKSRTSLTKPSYKDESDSDGDEPLVGDFWQLTGGSNNI